MLLFSTASITVDGCTVFPDHADVNQFWYLPAPVDLAPMPDSDEPQFLLIEYAPDVASTGVEGVGFLNLTTALRLKDETRQDIMGQIRSAFPTADNPRLAPVPFDDGSVRIVALDLQGGGGTKNTAPPGSFLVTEQILGATSPELFGDNNALFAITLSEAGASIMKAAFEGGMAPVGVIYDLKFTGVRPALDVKVTADLKRVYDSFSVDVTAKVYWVSAGVDATFEKLRQNGAIKIEVVNLVGDQTSLDKEKEALALFKDQILSTWFTPSLSPATAAAADAKSVGLPNNTTTSTTTTTTPPKAGAPNNTPPKAGQQPAAQNPAAKPAAQPAQPKAQPQAQAAGNHPPAAAGAAAPKPAGGAVAAANPPGGVIQGGTTAANAGGAVGGAIGGPVGGAVGGAAGGAIGTAVGGPAGAAVGTAIGGAAGGAIGGAVGGAVGNAVGGGANPPAGGGAAGGVQGGAGQGAGGSSTTTSQAPSTAGQVADAAKSLAGAASGASSAASPFGVSVQLKFVHQDELKTVTYEYNRMDAVQRTYAPQGYFALMLAKIDKSKHFLQVDGNDVFFNKFSIAITPPRDFASIGLQTVHAALDYGDPTSAAHKHGEFNFDVAHTAPTSWDVFQGQIKTTDFTYAVDFSFDPQVGWVGADDKYQLPAVTTANRQLTLDPFATLGFMTVSIAPGHIDANVVDRVDVVVQYTDDTWQTSNTFTVRSGSNPQSWKVRLADKTKRDYTYTTTCVLKDGTTFPHDPVTSSANTVFVNDAFSGGLDVTVQPAFDATKTKAALVEIGYDDTPSNYRFHKTVFMQPGNIQPTVMHIPVLDPTKRTYTYRITTVGIDDSQHKGDPVATTDLDVLVGDLP